MRAQADIHEFLSNYPLLAVLTGAGISTASGIPAYRDRNGHWKHRQPMQFGEFVGSEKARQKYWSRSYIGWHRFSSASPNTAHRALAKLEASGAVHTLITQNVDGLHGAAGTRSLVELHGNLDRVICTRCDATEARSRFQEKLARLNPRQRTAATALRPDGDVDVPGSNDYTFRVPPCGNCGGILKPDVVMFGESVPSSRVEQTRRAIDQARGLLVVGSSLMVFSGYRFARYAAEQSKPVAILNLGKTRADDLAKFKWQVDCASALESLARHHASGQANATY